MLYYYNLTTVRKRERDRERESEREGDCVDYVLSDQDIIDMFYVAGADAALPGEKSN